MRDALDLNDRLS